MVVMADGRLPLPWLAGPLADARAQWRSHALLVHGPAGIGALELALCLAQSALCERGVGRDGLPCGQCAGCHAVQQHTHADLFVLMPEEQRLSSGWLLAGDRADAGSTAEEGAKARRKPSRQIRIDEVRAAIDWASTTSARGGAKLIVLHPAEAMNLQAASALLKTLEEPPAAVRLILVTHDPHWLLPTIRSRCQPWPMTPPGNADSLAWLQAEGIGEPSVLLAGAGGSPLRARDWAVAGIDGAAWAALPAAVAQGRGAAALSGWPLARAIDALQRLCHDAMRVAVGGQPSYFSQGKVPAGDAGALAVWQRELVRVGRHDEHPWNEGLLLESLAAQGRRALQASRPSRAQTPLDTLRA